jgi:predicted NBD/HSP70 family sugar kinase
MRQFLTIDTGGTKTRIIQFDGDFSDSSQAYSAPILYEIDIPTPHSENEYVENVAAAIEQNFPEFYKSPEENVVILATRGVVKDGRVTTKRLDWRNFAVADRLSEKLNGAKVLVGNDAMIGTYGAFEKNFGSRGLYLTLGTGVGAGLMIDDEPSNDVINSEPGHMKLMHDGKFTPWEDFASGAAWFERSGGRNGHDLPADDPIWHWYAENLAAGIIALLPVLCPDTIAIGGKMAEFFDKYADDLRKIVAEQAWPPVAKVNIVAVSDPRYTNNRGALVYGLKQMEKANEN